MLLKVSSQNSHRSLFLLLFVGSMFASLSMQAQSIAPIAVPYFMGFEESDSLELSYWVLNPGPQAPACQDQWMVGSATRNGGRRSLYISADGEEAEFGASPNVQYVYRDFTVAAGRYECSFDYRCMGASNSSLSAGVSFVSSLSKDMVAKSGSGTIPNSINAACLAKNLKGSAQWKNTSFSFSATASGTYRLFFFPSSTIWIPTGKPLPPL